MSMSMLYWAVFGFGTMLTGASFFLGDADADFDADLDADVDLDADADADLDADGEAPSGGFAFSALPFASLRFWMFFADTFGLTGALLSLLGVPAGWTFTIASLTGTAFGYGAFQLFRWLAREQVSAETESGAYVGEEARVLLDCKPDAHGKIVLETLAGRVELLARSADPQPIGRGRKVLVAHVDNGVAEVTALPD